MAVYIFLMDSFIWYCISNRLLVQHLLLYRRVIHYCYLRDNKFKCGWQPWNWNTTELSDRVRSKKKYASLVPCFILIRLRYTDFFRYKCQCAWYLYYIQQTVTQTPSWQLHVICVGQVSAHYIARYEKKHFYFIVIQNNWFSLKM